jgi:hypothetical protein
MKYLKMLGLAAITAAAVMAFAGAGTASAETTLCKEKNLTSCYGAGTTLHAVSIAGQGVSRPIMTGGFDIECDSAFEVKIDSATTPTGKIAALTWTNCTGGTWATKTLGSIQLHHTSGNSGKVTINNWVWTVTLFGVDCFYGGPIEGTFIGSATSPQINITADLSRINTSDHPSSGFCPEKANWHATYKIDKVNGVASPLWLVTGV